MTTRRIDSRSSHAGAAVAFTRGEAAVDREDWDGARTAFAEAVRLAPDEPEYRLALAELLLSDAEDPEELVVAAEHARAGAASPGALDDREVRYELLVTEAAALTELNVLEGALEVLETAAMLWPEGFDARAERSRVLFELLRLDEAEREAKTLSDAWPQEPWPHHLIGLVLERRGADAESKQRLSRATALDPEEFPAPVALEEGEFDAIVEEAVAQLPAPAREALTHNVSIAVERFPPEEDLRGAEPPLSPMSLGMFRGTPLGERSVTRASDHDTAAVVLYQNNLERFATTRDELREQVRITLLHELGHLLGLDEDDLAERGLD